ncbi:hypothetical protein D9M71_417640 [compost metagenome]
MLFLGQPGALDQRQRQGNEAGHEDGVQYQDADVQAQQVGVLQGRDQRLPGDAGFAVLHAVIRHRHDEQDDQYADQRHPRREPEQAMQAEPMRQHRARDHRGGEGDTDAHADDGHGLGAMLLAGEVREQRHHHRGNGARPLDHPAGDHAPDGLGAGRDRRADGKYQQADDDDRAPADTVGQRPQGNLQYRLGQPVGPHGKADQRRCRVDQVHAVGHHDRQQHEHAEHTEGIEHGQAGCRPEFCATHALSVGIVHKSLEGSLGWASCPARRSRPLPGGWRHSAPKNSRAF